MRLGKTSVDMRDIAVHLIQRDANWCWIGDGANQSAESTVGRAAGRNDESKTSVIRAATSARPLLFISRRLF